MVRADEVIEEEHFEQFWKIMSNYYDIVSLKVFKDQTILMIAVLSKNKNELLKLADSWDDNIQKIQGKYLPGCYVTPLSGYVLPLYPKNLTKLTKNNIIQTSDPNTFFKFFIFKSINSHDTPIRVFKTISKLNSYFYVISTNSIGTEGHQNSFSIGIKTTSENEIDHLEHSLIKILKQNPFFKGELIKPNHKYVKNNIGKVSLGIFKNQLDQVDFYDTIKVLPRLITKKLPVLQQQVFPMECLYSTINNEASPNFRKQTEKEDKSTQISTIPQFHSSDLKLEANSSLKILVDQYNWKIHNTRMSEDYTRTGINLSNNSVSLNADLSNNNLTLHQINFS